MPLYEYKCEECGAKFETIQKFSDEPLDKCEECGAPSPKKLLSSGSFSLKGGGWYADGYSKAKGS